ncbi:hypothetical protein BC629DRAFT_1502878 [Irpex lacteus]|nr:hypothetical protein BC629DRAFT_1502878 [Irpex lacteus]
MLKASTMANSSVPFSGIVYSSPTGDLQQLPLDKVVVDAIVVDFSARVDIIQRFHNPSPNATPRAKYLFPLPARAAICGFEMHTADDRLLLGKVKLRQQAQAEHEAALRQGKATALLDWATDDVFVTSIGSVPGCESITIVTTYVMDLLHGDVESEVRLIVPMAVGQRYGPTPTDRADASSPSSHTKIRFNVHIQMQGEIKLVTCPSAHDRLVLQPYRTHTGKTCKRRMVAKLRSNEFMTQDFVLKIEAEGLSESRCLVEYHNANKKSVALRLTLYPKFDLPARTAQEFIFLVDCSESMDGSRIDTAKKALTRLLHILPAHGTTFNVFRFGSSCDSHWPRSRAYADNSMAEIGNHVSSLDANLGRTEIRNALQKTLYSRDVGSPTTVILLTDGEVDDPERIATKTLVQKAVARSHEEAPLRVFTLAIGEQVSTAMCQDIADAGNGECLWATASESIVQKCATLVRAGSTFALKDIFVHWGIGSDLLHEDPSSRAARLLADGQVIRQSPSTIPALYPGIRHTVYALLEGDNITVPDEVILHARRDGTGPPLEFRIPVQRIKFEAENTHVQLLHTLAARAMIQELENLTLDGSIFTEDKVKTSIISLAEQYQLASRFTSFVTEDTDNLDLNAEPMTSQALRAIRHRHLKQKIDSYNMHPHSPRPINSFVRMAVDYASAFKSALMQTWLRTSAPPPATAAPSRTHRNSLAMPGDIGRDTASEDADMHSVHSDQHEEEWPTQEDDDGYASDGTFTTLSSLLSTVDSSDWDDSRPSSPVDDNARSPSPEVKTSDDDLPSTIGPIARPPSPPPPILDPEVESLIGVMKADGSFVDSHQLEQSVGRTAIDEWKKLQVDCILWTTALAVVYFEKRLHSDRIMLEPVYEKAREYGCTHGASHSTGALTFDQLLDRARAVLST